jgi:hypothetical protein
MSGSAPTSSTFGWETGELSLWSALRAATKTITDDFVRFVAGNVAWMAVVGTALLAGRVYVPGYALVVLVVAASFGLGRMAAFGVRGCPPRLVWLWAGFTHRGWAGFGLGCLQLIMLAVAVANIAIAIQAPRLQLIVSAVVSGYAGLFLAATVLAVWPLLLDPRRGDKTISQIVRLGLVVIAARPGRLLALVVVEAGLVAVGLQTFVAALVLPSFGLLLASWVVLPLADEMAPEVGASWNSMKAGATTRR